MALTPGTRLGPYEILSPLGSGGMGEVYRARDSRLGREVALKLIGGALASDPERRSRFVREARLLAALEHQNVAVIHAIEEQDGTLFLVLELVEGRTLDAILAGGPLPPAEALDVARQVGEALEAAHGRGIIHRDLKPSNVRLTPNGVVKVLDSGLGKSVAEAGPEVSVTATATLGLTGVGAVLGTPAYMSPEQARGRPAGPPADVWSLGCLLYEMLAGRRAFGGETATDCLAAIVSGSADWHALPRGTPVAVRRLLARCLEKDAPRRPEISEARREIAAAQRRLEGRTPLRRPAALVAVSIAVAGVVVVLLIFARRASGPAPPPSPKLSQLTIVEGLEQSPAWSPDGRSLAFQSDRSGRLEAWVMGRDGSNLRQLTRVGVTGHFLRWTPDGGAVVFRCPEGGKPVTMEAPLDGGDSRPLPEVKGGSHMSFSPGGDLILDVLAHKTLWVSPLRGGTPAEVFSFEDPDVRIDYPVWSPDGRWVLFDRFRPQGAALWLLEDVE